MCVFKVPTKPLIMVFQQLGLKITRILNVRQTFKPPEDFYRIKCVIRNATLAGKQYQQFIMSKTVDLKMS